MDCDWWSIRRWVESKIKCFLKSSTWHWKRGITEFNKWLTFTGKTLWMFSEQQTGICSAFWNHWTENKLKVNCSLKWAILSSIVMMLKCLRKVINNLSCILTSAWVERNIKILVDREIENEPKKCHHGSAFFFLEFPNKYFLFSIGAQKLSCGLQEINGSSKYVNLWSMLRWRILICWDLIHSDGHDRDREYFSKFYFMYILLPIIYR